MESTPQLSIVICTYNRASYLQDTLRTLSRQDTNSDVYEIIVVDNNSTDDTAKIVESFVGENPEARIRCVFEPVQGLSHARNRGAKEARAELVAYVDDDIFADPSYVSALIDYFATHPDVDAVGGRIDVHYDSPPPDWASRYLRPLFGDHNLGDSPRPYPPDRYPLGGNMCFRRRVLLQSGGFDPDLGRKGGELLASEEKDLFHRLRRDGAVIHFLPSARIRHRVDSERYTHEFVRRQAVGIGRSERLRVKSRGGGAVVSKAVSEVIKLGGTLVLSAGFLLRGEPARAAMLVRFRGWVWKGLLG